MTRKAAFAPDEYYHIYNRGIEKRIIFTQKADYERFLALLYACNGTAPVHLQLQGLTLKNLLGSDFDKGEALVDICAYCLMPNHFHLLLRERVPGGISKFMQKLTTAYTMYFNKRHERSGALFQGTFKSTHAGRDEYLKYLLAYIHLNPVKLVDSTWKEVGIRDLNATETYLKEYTSSSFLDYTGETRLEAKLLNREALPAYFPLPEDFMAEMAEWLNFKVKP